MKILYISDSRLPSQRANSIQVAKTCEALSKAGCDVTLLLPNRRENRTYGDKYVWSYYNIKHKFRIVRVPAVDLPMLHKLKIPRLWFFISTITFTLSALKYFGSNKDFDIIYSRHEPTATLIARLFDNRPPVVCEVHKFSSMRSKHMNGIDGVAAITARMAELYSETFDLPTAVIPDAADLSFIEKAPPKKLARARLKLEKSAKLLIYTGSLQKWKGVETLVAAARELPNFTIIVVGGKKQDINRLRTKAPENVIFTGHVPASRIPLFLSAADVLILPNKKDRISSEYTSPLKLFEYMAAERPIVASDLPSLREVLNEDSAFFFEPENPHSLAAAIRLALSPSAAKRAKKARSLAKDYTWEKRSEKIIQFLKSLSKLRQR